MEHICLSCYDYQHKGSRHVWLNWGPQLNIFYSYDKFYYKECHLLRYFHRKIVKIVNYSCKKGFITPVTVSHSEGRALLLRQGGFSIWWRDSCKTHGTGHWREGKKVLIEAIFIFVLNSILILTLYAINSLPFLLYLFPIFLLLSKDNLMGQML